METTTSTFGQSTVRRAIARLVAAMMVADRRLATGELDEATRLDGIGLGPLGPLVQEELERATRMPIDLDTACAPLRGTGPALTGTVLSVLADVAESDGAIDDDEARVFAAIAGRLGAGSRDIRDFVAAEGPAPETPPAVPSSAAALVANGDATHALRAFGLGADATRAEIDAAYLALVERYDPAKVVPLGAEFVVLAVQKLAALTSLYEIACDAAA
jgi:DnaJ-domain-containing protein 1